MHIKGFCWLPSHRKVLRWALVLKDVCACSNSGGSGMCMPTERSWLWVVCMVFGERWLWCPQPFLRVWWGPAEIFVADCYTTVPGACSLFPPVVMGCTCISFCKADVGSANLRVAGLPAEPMSAMKYNAIKYRYVVLLVSSLTIQSCGGHWWQGCSVQWAQLMWHPRMANRGCTEPHSSWGDICVSRYSAAIVMDVESEVLLLRTWWPHCTCFGVCFD